MASCKIRPNKSLQPTASPLRGLSAAELKRYTPSTIRGVIVAERPVVEAGEWILIGAPASGTRVSGLVMLVASEHLVVGYHQNQMKAIKEDVVWVNDHWEFKSQGPCGSYLHGAEAAAVKRGPPFPS